MRTASSAGALTAGSTPRVCTATLAGLRLQPDAGVVARRSTGSAARSRSCELAQLGREPLDEADVELGAVAADQVHLAGQPGERGQVAQRPAGDDRHGGLRQRGQRPDRRDRLGQRDGRAGSSTIGARVPS